MSEKKLLVRFQEPWKAELIRNLLQSEGIDSLSLKAPREYSSIVTGIGGDEEEIYVSESDFAVAQAILQRYERSTRLTVVDSETEIKQAKKASRRFFVFAGVLFAVILLCTGLYYVFVAVK